MSRSQRHKIEEQGFSSRGQIYEQGAVNDQILKSIGGAVAGAQPVLTSINPATAVKGGADLTMHALGSGFDANTKIIFNGGAEITTFVNAGDITTVVKPSLVQAPTPFNAPVQVRKGNSLVSAATKYFTFTATELEDPEGFAARSGGEEERNLGPFNLLRIEPDDDGGAWYVFDRIDIREGDRVRVEATGNSGTNGDFDVVDVSDEVANETAIYWPEATLPGDIVGKGRVTILSAGGAV